MARWLALAQLLLLGLPLLVSGLTHELQHSRGGVTDSPNVLAHATVTDKPVPWVAHNEKTKFPKDKARDCLTNRTVLILGNSVARHWYFSLRYKLGNNVCHKEGRACEKTLCGTGGAAGGQRQGQGGCASACGCDIYVGDGTHLVFLWQQRIFDPKLRSAIEEYDPDLVVMNAGGDDIFAETSRPLFKERIQAQTPKLRKMLMDMLQRRPGEKPREIYWRTTTAVCNKGPHFGVEDVSTLNPLIEESNKAIASELADVKGLHFLDGYAWTAGQCSVYDDVIHHSTIVYSHLNTWLKDYCPGAGQSRFVPLAAEELLGKPGKPRAAGRDRGKSSAVVVGSTEEDERLFGFPYGPDDTYHEEN